jgi:hypothetical protein
VKEITKLPKDINFQCTFVEITSIIKNKKKSTSKMYFKNKVVEMEIFALKRKIYNESRKF